MEDSPKTLIAIGAGPKSIAIGCKLKTLADCGYSVPRFIAIERNRLAGNWVGGFGYTDGFQRLCTEPEKDLGFPYDVSEASFGRTIATKMLDFSWQRFLVEQELFGGYVDRGRPHPTHRQWSEYLDWAASRCGLEVVHGDVQMATVANGRWRISYQASRGKTSKIDADGVVITGPGEPYRLLGEPRDNPRVLDGKSFWLNLARFDGLEASMIVVIGSGETAAAIVTELNHRLHADTPVYIINRHGTIFTRGESYHENRFYSDPSDWDDLRAEDRREIIRRTDRGVFSPRSNKTLDQTRDVKHEPVEVERIEMRRGFPCIIGRYGTTQKQFICEYVINARSFNALSTLSLFKRLPEKINARIHNRRIDEIEADIGSDLAIKDLMPKLHLPMLSAFAQGPGFPNLTCLGLLSDRILKKNYVQELNNDH